MRELPDWAHPMSASIFPSTTIHPLCLSLAEQITRVLKEEIFWRETLFDRGSHPSLRLPFRASADMAQASKRFQRRQADRN
jgi:hypothetical protein